MAAPALLVPLLVLLCFFSSSYHVHAGLKFAAKLDELLCFLLKGLALARCHPCLVV